MRSLIVGLVSAGILLQGATGHKIEARYAVPGNGGFDYVTVDSDARRVYLSHGNQVDVIDADNGKHIGTISDTPGVHGIAIASALKRGFTTNGRESKVSMFDPSNLQLIRKIEVGKGPDGIYYDASSKRVFTNNHGSHDITAIDAESGDVVGTVKAGGDPEQTVKGADGLLYVTIEDTAEVIAYDPKSLEVKHRYPIGVCKVPTGLAYDAESNRLFASCRSQPMMVVMDAGSGKVITNLPIGAGADWSEFDPDAKLIFVSTAEGTLNIFHQKSADEYEDAGAIKTQQSAKTMGFDPKTKKIYLPAAEYEMKPGPDPSKPAVRTLKPGSFTVLVISR